MQSSSSLTLGNNVSDIMPKIVEFLQAAESLVEEMVVSSGVPQSHDKRSLVSCKASLLAKMKDAMSTLNLPDLAEFLRNDPKIMASELIKIFSNEEVHLRTLCENQANDSKDTANEIKNQSSKLKMIENIQNGLNNRNTFDEGKLKEEINELKQLNKQLKADFNTICTKCCPELKDDIKKIFSALEASQYCVNEEDRWVDLSSLNFKMESLNLLLLADIVEFDYEGMRIRFISIE